jgi:high-affinity iron transporter
MDAFVITLREGIEAALVIGIVLAFVGRAERRDLARWVLGGAAAGALFSVLLAVGLQRAGLGADSPMVEAVLFAVAAVAVVSMVVWMLSASRGVQGQIEGKVERILCACGTGGTAAWTLFGFAAFMVAREGVEMALFLGASALGGANGPATLVGGVLGLAAAVAYGVVFARGGLKLDLGLFFKLTSVALLLLAGKLILGSVHEFEEAGVLPMSESLAHLFDALAGSSIVDYVFLLAVAVPFVGPVLRRFRAGRRLQSCSDAE